MSNIMIMGTSSHVGKSVLTAGLLRVLAQDGYHPAPFKAQNMSLNATVTPDGREIAWSQAVQAEAAGVAPCADMNPVLLKPSGPSRSQIVLQGRVLGETEARAYFYDGKERLWAAVVESYRRLAAQHPVLVVEGAGSPVEMNLKPWDLSNMRTAALANAWVLLVADIERGGVFASLTGTLDLLEPGERRRVAGLVVNKFRGDPRLFEDGVRWLEDRTGIPVWGVLPYLEHLDIDEEDSLGLDARPGPQRDDVLQAALIRLPHVANFNDFDPLQADPRVQVRWCGHPEELGSADLIVLPGTKNTMEDLVWLHTNGWADAVCRAFARGAHVLGICGGYQMLGRLVRDPDHVESALPEVPGLGLVDQVTTLAPVKTTTRVQAVLQAPFPPAPVFGYELHMGRTESRASLAPLCRIDGRPDGVVAHGGRLLGTYIHGLLENRNFHDGWLGRVAAAAGRPWPALATVSASARRQAAYDRLADALRRHLDLSRLPTLLQTTPPSAESAPRS